MPKIIRDFIASGRSEHGVGFFAGDKLAVEIARNMGKSQTRQFKRKGEVPGGFFRYLKERRIIPLSADTTRETIGRTVNDLLEFLWTCPYQNQKARDAGEYIRKLILLSIYPDLKRAYRGYKKPARSRAT